MLMHGWNEKVCVCVCVCKRQREEEGILPPSSACGELPGEAERTIQWGHSQMPSGLILTCLFTGVACRRQRNRYSFRLPQGREVYCLGECDVVERDGHPQQGIQE